MTPGIKRPRRARTGGRILVDQLIINGVRRVFCVPGESYLAVLDAFHDSDIDLIVCRQEGGAAMMAEACGKLTGHPGVCFVTRGPGATNASAGIHIARQDSSPMILFVGQVERGMRDREAFQELNYRAVFGSMAKWVTEIDDAARIPEIVAHAFTTAMSGRPGPVVIALPEDMLAEAAATADALPAVRIETHPGVPQVAELQALLAKARQPVAILGGSRWTAQAVEQFERFADDFQLPVAVSFRRQMLFSADHPCFIGDLGLGPNPKLLEHIKAADLVLLIGGRLSETPSQGYTLLDIPAPAQALVHVHPDADELGRVYQPRLAIHAAPDAFAAAVEGVRSAGTPSWADATRALRQSYLQWSDPAGIITPGRLQMSGVMRYLGERLPADAVMCNGAGNFATWVHRFHRFRRFGTQLAPASGSMGYSVPAGVAAKLAHPDRTVVVFAGDGDFMMNGQEFATAVQYQAPIIVVLADNGMYGTIRMHQEKSYPGRVSGTLLINPDFAGYARAFGGHGERVASTEEFAPAFERALASGRPAILHCLIDPEAITPVTTLSALRESARVNGREKR